jgi:hypothetical protein
MQPLLDSIRNREGECGPSNVNLAFKNGSAMYQNVSSRPFSSEIRVSFQVTPCEICGGYSRNIIALPFFIQIWLHVALTRRKNGRNLETIRKELLYLQLVSVGVEKYFHIFTLSRVSG